mgnify:FL=1
MKDKKALETTRRSIEVKMENFKVCERETKTKAFSKEGLAGASKTDPAMAAKMHTAGWLRDNISELEECIEQLEFDLENDGGGKRGKKGQVDEREERMTKHKYHVLRMEQLLRLVENGDLEPSEVDDIEDTMQAYVDACKEEGGYKYEEEGDPEMDIFSVFGMPDVSTANYAANRGMSSSDDDSESGSAAPAASAKPPPPREEPKKEEPSGGRVIDKRPEPKKAEPQSPATAKAPVPVATVKQPPAPPAAVKGKEAPPLAAIVKGTAAAAAAGPQSPQQPAKPATAAAVVAAGRSPNITSPQAAAPQAALPAKLPMSALVGGKTTPGTPQPSFAAAAAAKPSPSTYTGPTPGASAFLSTPRGLQPQPAAPTAVDEAAPLDDEDDALNDDTFGDDALPPTDASLADLSSMTRQREWAAANAAAAATNAQGLAPPQAAAANSRPAAPSQALPPPQPPAAASSWANRAAPTAVVTAPPPAAPQVAPQPQPTATATPPSAVSAAVTAAAEAAANRAQTIRMLDMSLRNLPHTSDCERLKPYSPPNPCTTPAYYPQVSHPTFSLPETFQKFCTDILFFIFYYQQTTYQQYLAAKELKRQAWRFHKKFWTWFQRHDKPKSSNEEQETGTYLYFDFERGWCNQIKTDFVFKYSYLEDELV